MSKLEWDSEALLQPARAARRSEQDEQYYGEELRKALAELGRILNVANDGLGLVSSLDDLEEAAASVLNGTLARRLHALATARDERVQTLARACGTLWSAIQSLRNDIHKEEQE